MEPLQPAAGAAVHRAPGGGEGHRLVPPPARPPGVRGGHGRPLRALLEHADGPAAAVHGHRLPGLQPGLVQARQRAGEHARILSEPDPGVEVPVPHAGGQADGPLLQSPLPGHVSRRGGHRHGRRRRDPALLERVQQNAVDEGVGVGVEPVYQDTVILGLGLGAGDLREEGAQTESHKAQIILPETDRTTAPPARPSGEER
ncbi:hypothetical protein ANANG_G00093510 [Anguilla anguilla]|uniref:Uncharacterized protein n=1 Tax=Anguilla anguilla TaxID=7936 RepID=A0A9D3S1Q4_ANGAN|nr:hypothetical protein ANANG_G00093510 [Anguilla anguilla]